MAEAVDRICDSENNGGLYVRGVAVVDVPDLVGVVLGVDG